jgi:hypothetical protein
MKNTHLSQNQFSISSEKRLIGFSGRTPEARNDAERSNRDYNLDIKDRKGAKIDVIEQTLEAQGKRFEQLYKKIDQMKPGTKKNELLESKTKLQNWFQYYSEWIREYKGEMMAKRNEWEKNQTIAEAEIAMLEEKLGIPQEERYENTTRNYFRSLILESGSFNVKKSASGYKYMDVPDDWTFIAKKGITWIDATTAIEDVNGFGAGASKTALDISGGRKRIHFLANGANAEMAVRLSSGVTVDVPMRNGEFDLTALKVEAAKEQGRMTEKQKQIDTFKREAREIFRQGEERMKQAYEKIQSDTATAKDVDDYEKTISDLQITYRDTIRKARELGITENRQAMENIAQRLKDAHVGADIRRAEIAEGLGKVDDMMKSRVAVEKSFNENKEKKNWTLVRADGEFVEAHQKDLLPVRDRDTSGERITVYQGAGKIASLYLDEINKVASQVGIFDIYDAIAKSEKGKVDVWVKASDMGLEMQHFENPSDDRRPKSERLAASFMPGSEVMRMSDGVIYERSKQPGKEHRYYYRKLDPNSDKGWEIIKNEYDVPKSTIEKASIEAAKEEFERPFKIRKEKFHRLITKIDYDGLVNPTGGSHSDEKVYMNFEAVKDKENRIETLVDTFRKIKALDGSMTIENESDTAVTVSFPTKNLDQVLEAFKA